MKKDRANEPEVGIMIVLEVMKILKDLKSQDLVLSMAFDESRCSSHFVVSRKILPVTVGKI